MRTPHHRDRLVTQFALSLLAAFLASGTTHAQYVRLVGDGEPWTYFKGVSEPAGPPGAWTSVGYDDSSWASGITPLGTLNAREATLLGDMVGNYASVYIRKSFPFAGDRGLFPTLTRLWLTVDYQDGFVAYLNGVEIARHGLGAPRTRVTHDTLASPHRAGILETVEATAFLDLLQTGGNVLAIEGHAASPRSPGFSLAATLHATGPVPVTRYPYLGRPSARTVIIAWKTARPCVGGVFCVPRGVGKVPGGSRAFMEGPLTSLHALTLTGLAADTDYSYVVYADGRPLTGGDVFRTLPAPGTDRIEFNAVGDSGVNTGRSRALRSRWIATGVPLGLRLGDIAYANGNEREFDINYFSVQRDFLRRGFDMPAMGNHDARVNEGDTYVRTFFVPEDFPGGDKRYYAFEVGPALFVSLDMFTSEYGAGSAERAWLEQTLVASSARWKFVFMHWGPYSCSTAHGSNLKARASLSPLFELHGVDIVFSGHDHGYERSRPVLDFGEGGSPVRYIVSGGGGREIDKWRTDCAWTADTASTHEFVHVSVDGSCLALSAIRADGSVVDSESYCKDLPSAGGGEAPVRTSRERSRRYGDEPCGSTQW